MGGPETHNQVFTPQTTAGRIGKVLFRHRGPMPVPFLLGAIATLIWRGDTFGSAIPFWASASGGAIICAIGHVLRVWSIGHAGRETRRTRIAAKRLATSGPFAYSRNPIYIANLLIAIGLGLISRTAWLALAFPPLFFIQYYFIIRYEEEFLDYTFGEEYRAYRSRTPRYIGIAHPDREGAEPFDSSQPLGKEYQAVLATVCAAGIFVAALMIR